MSRVTKSPGWGTSDSWATASGNRRKTLRSAAARSADVYALVGIRASVNDAPAPFSMAARSR